MMANIEMYPSKQWTVAIIQIIFMRVTTESYTILLALKILNIRTLTDVLKSVQRPEGASGFLKTVSHNTVEQLLHQVPMSDVALV